MVNAPEPYAGDTTRSPLVAFAIGSIVCALVSVGILVFYVPRPASLTWASGFSAASAALLLAAIVSLLRRRLFAWQRFFIVARWVLLLTLVYTGMLEYVIVFDGARGKPLIIMTIVLLLTAIDVPILWAFSVARHERISS
jgi:hypothetical protein